MIDFVKEYTDVDCTKYLCNILSFDMLTLNTDRHFHNIALIQTKSGYQECPIFDNGAALLSNYGMFPPYEKLEEHISHAAAKPFSGSFEQQAVVLGTDIRLDMEAISEEIKKIDHVRIRAVLEYQLKRYKNHSHNFFISLSEQPEEFRYNCIIHVPLVFSIVLQGQVKSPFPFSDPLLS